MTTKQQTTSDAEKLEQILIHCHMALISVWPASDAWGEVGKWLVKNGTSKYAKELRAHHRKKGQVRSERRIR